MGNVRAAACAIMIVMLLNIVIVISLWYDGGSWGGGVHAVLFGAFVLLYFWPSTTAMSREKVNALSIFIINLFFGWTIVGWAICLSWAYSTSQVDISESKKDDISST